MSLLVVSSVTGGSARKYVKRALVTGMAVVVPVLLTVFVLMIVVNFFSQFLTPVAGVIQEVFGFTETPDLLLEGVTAAAFLLVVFAIGAVAESRHKTGIDRRFESAMSAIPGVGSIYSNLNEISELLVEQDTESFEEVKLIEFPQEESYMLGFVTAEMPAVAQQATETPEMITLFAPMGPNPFMGGFVIHISTEKVYEIDLTVEEGIQTIVSSGVSINDPDQFETDAESGGQS